MQFYLTLLDTYVPDEAERHEAFAAVDNIPSIKAKADFCFRWIDSVFDLDALETRDHRRAFLLNLDLLRGGHRGPVLLRRLRLRLLPPLARAAQRPGLGHELGLPRRVDAHGVRVRRRRHRPRGGARPLRRASSPPTVRQMLVEASTPRRSSPRTSSAAGSPGSRRPTCAPTSSTSPTGGCERLGLPSRSTARSNPLAFMELQDVQELSNFFERTGVGLPGGGHRLGRRSTRTSDPRRVGRAEVPRPGGLTRAAPGWNRLRHVRHARPAGRAPSARTPGPASPAPR